MIFISLDLTFLEFLIELIQNGNISKLETIEEEEKKLKLANEEMKKLKRKRTKKNDDLEEGGTKLIKRYWFENEYNTIINL